jgi:hypothetical protein
MLLREGTISGKETVLLMIRDTLFLRTGIINGRDTALLRERSISARDTIDGKGIIGVTDTLLLRERINR